MPTETKAEAIARANAPREAKLKELEALKAQQDEAAKLAEIDERRGRYAEVFEAAQRKRLNKQREKSGEMERLVELWDERIALEREFRENPPLSADSAVDQLAKLDERVAKVQEVIRKRRLLPWVS